jgi:hypothetical protein
MTLVVGQQFRDRLIVLSDTMITDPSSARSNIIPGQLKTVILCTNLCVSFAGRVGPALSAIRRIQPNLTKEGNIEVILDILRAETARNEDIEFLVASRIPHPALYAIKAGQKYFGSDRYWLGDGRGASKLQNILDAESDIQVPEQEYCTTAEIKLRLAFLDLVCERRMPGIGGVPVFCLGSREGFAYENHAGFFGYGTVNIPETAEQQELRLALERSGMGPTYSFSVTASRHRGTATIGVFFPQAEMGYLYSPIDYDQPKKFYPISLDELQKQVTAYAARLR